MPASGRVSAIGELTSIPEPCAAGANVCGLSLQGQIARGMQCVPSLPLEHFPASPGVFWAEIGDRLVVACASRGRLRTNALRAQSGPGAFSLEPRSVLG